MFHKKGSLVTRILFLAFTTIFFSIFFAGTIIIWNFNKSQNRTLTAYLTAYNDILVAATYLDENNNFLVSDSVAIFDNMPFYWQISKNGKLITKSVNLVDPIKEDISAGEIKNLYLKNQKVEITVISKSYNFPGEQNITYLFGLHKEIADAFLKEETFKFTSSLLIILVLLTLFLIVTVSFIQVKASINPLKKIKEKIAKIKSGEEKKIEDDFPKEINLLVDEINKLIEYNSAIIKRYRNFAANLSHALKTPLTVLSNSAQKDNDKNLAQLTKEKSEDMIALINRNLARVNTMPENEIFSTRCNILPILKRITKNFGKLYEKEIEIKNELKEDVFSGNEADLYEILGNIIENACKYCTKNIKVLLTKKETTLTIIVEDDGDGIPEEKLSDVLKYGIRLDKNKQGSGVGLAVTNEIIKIYGGNLKLSKSAMGGLKVEMNFT